MDGSLVGPTEGNAVWMLGLSEGLLVGLAVG